jgi:cyclophilin family peptidyl-prolyl cis-trans isomerase
VATEKRERQRAARQAKQEAGHTEETRSRRTRTIVRVVGILAAVLVAAFLFNFLFGDEGGDVDDVTTSDEDDEAVEDEAADDEPADDEAEEDEAGEDEFAFEAPDISDDCPPAEGAGERTTEFDGPAPWCLDLDRTYILEVATDAGLFEITLDTENAPVAANNLVFLARNQYYEGTIFHRVIPDFVVQGGDAGDGAPGYTLGDDQLFLGELPDAEPYYPEMSVAMANVDANPFSATSQFFVVTGPRGERLDPDFTRVGEVTAGEDVVRGIEATGEDADDAGLPTEPVTIESVSVTESEG